MNENYNRRYVIIISIILAVKLFLNVYGINWGLPDRWNIDEKVGATLRMLGTKTIYPVYDVHPTLYNLLLFPFLLFYLGILKVVNYPLEQVKSAASVSWINMAYHFPAFCSHVYMIARSVSCVLGVFSVFVIYKIGDLIFDKKTGLLSACALALTMGFAEVNHFAKGTSLVVLTSLFVLYFCLKALKGNNFTKYFLLACLFSGLSGASKYDGFITVTYLFSSYLIYHIPRAKDKNPDASGNTEVLKEFIRCKDIIWGFLFFFLGLFIGWPALFIHFHEYFSMNPITFTEPVLTNMGISLYLSKLIANIVRVTVIFGFPLAILAFSGVIHFLINYRKHFRDMLLLFSMLIPYFCVCIFFYTNYVGAATKFLILAVPILTLFAGRTATLLINSPKTTFSKLATYCLVGLIFLFSFIYTLRADLVFAKEDTRHKSTLWILENIPTHCSIEHLQDMDWLFSSIVTFRRNVIFYGRSSLSYEGSFYNLRDCQDVNPEKYIERLNVEGSGADYFVMAMLPERTEIETPPLVSRATGNKSFFAKLIDGETNFELLKKFEYRSSLLFRPRPSYTAPTVYIYKKKENTL